MRLVTTAFALTEPRFDQTRTQPPSVDAFLLRKLFRDLDEELRLQYGIHAVVLRPVVEMLGQTIGRCGIGEFLRCRELLEIVGEHARRRIAADLRRDRIGRDRRFERLIVDRERTIFHEAARKEPRRAFGVHDERA